MTFNPVLRTVSLCLPASKCDPTALGETVTHGCCCPVAGPWVPLCPYHLAVDHFRWLLKSRPDWFDADCEPLPGFPLFPCRSGGPCTKEGVMRTIRIAAEMLGMALKDSSGLWLHSGHALRVTGAQGLARAGLSVAAIMLIGRWGSDAVLNYIRRAPLFSSHRFAAAALCGWHAAHHGLAASLEPAWASPRYPPPPPSFTSQSSRRSRGKHVGGLLNDLRDRLDALEGRASPADVVVVDDVPDSHAVAAAPDTLPQVHLDELKDRVAAVEAAVADLVRIRSAICGALPPQRELITEAPVPSDAAPPGENFLADDAAQPRYVASANTIAGEARVGKVHTITVGPPPPPWAWKTACGWRYGCTARAKPIFALPNSYKLMCDRCLGPERIAARLVCEAAVTEAGGV